MLGSSSVAAQLAASQEGLSSMSERVTGTELSPCWILDLLINCGQQQTALDAEVCLYSLSFDLFHFV
jgi:hypothetical protein